MKKRVYIILGIMVAMVPLGLLTSSPAWGEWENDYYEKALGFVPDGIKNASSIKALMPDYSLNGVSEVGGYYLSALVGLAVIFVIYFVLAKLFRDRHEKPSL